MLKRKVRLENLSDFRYRDFYLFGLSMIIFGLIVDPLPVIWHGLSEIATAPSILLSDYMVIGGVGASFVNAGLMAMLSVYAADKSGARITGALFAGVLIVAGFSFFGKNIINSIPLMLGVYTYLKFKGLALKNFMHIVCFVTGMSPVVSLFMFGLELPFISGAILGIIAGLVVGFIIIPLSTSMLKFHDGYSLYNVGFSLGMIGVPIAGFLRMFDFHIPVLRILYEGDDRYILYFMVYICLSLIAYGLIANRGLKGYKAILKSSGRLVSDFTLISTKPLVLFNMGIMGLISILYVKLSGGILNGPIVGGIFTIIGFAAFGKHPRNVLPVMLGVLIATVFNKYDIASTDAILIALFSSTLAPIAGEFGLLAGILAGYMHKSVATNVGVVHGGINLYNNGLAGGIVAGIMVPLLKNFNERYKRD